MSMDSCKALFDLCKISTLTLLDVPQSDADYVLLISACDGPACEISQQRRELVKALQETDDLFEVHYPQSFLEKYKQPASAFSELSEYHVDKTPLDSFLDMLNSTHSLTCR